MTEDQKTLSKEEIEKEKEEKEKEIKIESLRKAGEIAKNVKKFTFAAFIISPSEIRGTNVLLKFFVWERTKA